MRSIIKRKSDLKKQHQLDFFNNHSDLLSNPETPLHSLKAFKSTAGRYSTMRNVQNLNYGRLSKRFTSIDEDGFSCNFDSEDGPRSLNTINDALLRHQIKNGMVRTNEMHRKRSRSTPFVTHKCEDFEEKPADHLTLNKPISLDKTGIKWGKSRKSFSEDRVVHMSTMTIRSLSNIIIDLLVQKFGANKGS